MSRRAVRYAFVASVLGAAPLVGGLASTGSAHVFAATGPTQLVAFYRLSPRRLQSSVPTVARRRAIRRAETAASPPVPTQSAPPAPPGPLAFQWPAQGSITTPFIPSGPLRHDGIDIGNLRSLTVVAADGGRVIHVGYTTGFEGYGNIVDIEPEPGVQVLYAHLSAMNVQVGDEVRQGQVIATAGCTGICYGTHLHFEVRIGGVPVNPLQFLP